MERKVENDNDKEKIIASLIHSDIVILISNDFLLNQIYVYKRRRARSFTFQ